MFWVPFKFCISLICLYVGYLSLTAGPVNIGSILVAGLFAFLAGALWIDYTKPQDAQNISPVRRKLSKIAICGLVIMFMTFFIHSLLSADTHISPRIFFNFIADLLKAL